MACLLVIQIDIKAVCIGCVLNQNTELHGTQQTVDILGFFLERMPENINWEIFLWPIKCNLQSILNIRNLCRAYRISSIQISGL